MPDGKDNTVSVIVLFTMPDGKDLNGIRIKGCTVNVYAVIYLCDNMCFFEWNQICAFFLSLP